MANATEMLFDAIKAKFGDVETVTRTQIVELWDAKAITKWPSAFVNSPSNRAGRGVYVLKPGAVAPAAAPAVAKVKAQKAPKPTAEVTETDEAETVTAPVAVAKPAKPAKVKAPKAPKATEVKKSAEELAEIRQSNLETMRAVAAKMAKLDKMIARDEVEGELGSTGEVATSYNIDGDFDSVEGLNIRQLILD
jgi:hypothetical protein